MFSSQQEKRQQLTLAELPPDACALRLCPGRRAPPCTRTCFILLLCGALVTGDGHAGESRQNTEPAGRPNFVLMVADDLGYGDVGAYGGEIQTPHINELARKGLLFTGFHTQATCSPTRAMMLTGVDNHLNGLGTMAEDLLPHHRNVPGYSGYLNNRVVTVASLLRDAGYHTYVAGKWHLGYGKQQNPAQRGFESSFVMLDGLGNHFNDDGPNAMVPRASYTRDGESIQRPEGFSSDLFTDQLIQQIAAHEGDRRPFFAYLAFSAPHFPLQAPAEYIEKYRHSYAKGWDLLRAERFQRLRERGLISAELTQPDRLDEVPAWTELSAAERQIEAKKMAVYAAMVDNIDANVGRLLQYLESIGQYDNTVIIFMSDNGTDPYDRSRRAIYKDYVSEQGYDNSLENMGNADSYIFQGPGWAQTGSVHLRYYKFLPYEGGTRVPFIIHYPKMKQRPETLSAFASVLDITPTLLDMAGLEHPGNRYRGREVHTPQGRSMLPYLREERAQVYAPDEAVAFELFGHASVFMGKWKAVRIRPPWDQNQWKLYDLDADPAESVDLGGQQASQLERMIDAFSAYALKNGVIDEPDGVTAYPAKPEYMRHIIDE